MVTWEKFKIFYVPFINDSLIKTIELKQWSIDKEWEGRSLKVIIGFFWLGFLSSAIKEKEEEVII